MKLTWVIGADSGIGEATARLLSTDRRRLVFSSGISECDVRSPTAIAAYWDAMYATSEFDGIDIVYSAGVNALAFVGTIDEYDMQHVFDVNVMGFIRVLNIVRSRGVEGVGVVAVGSDAADRPLRTSMSYCASKSALHAAIAVGARELAGAGWRVNGVAPGMTSGTKMTDYIDATVPPLRGWTGEAAYDYEMAQAVIKRRCTPGEVAATVQMLLDGPDYINGHIITINGGR